MPTTPDEIKELIKNFEGQTFDCKSHDILSHSDDLARLMVAFGNNKFVSEDFGGRIIIGVDSNGNLENFQTKQGHEEAIMNVARDKCHPSINPLFEKVNIDGKLVYVITVPKMRNTPYQLITKEGKTFRIRVGSTIREPTSNELEALFDNSDSSKSDRFSSLLASFPNTTYESIRQIAIVPLDSNSTMINFDKANTTFVSITQPRHAHTSKTKLVQNEFHYDGLDKANPLYGIINELGDYSLRENIKSQAKLIHLGREVVFLLAVFEYITKIYRHFGYNQRIHVFYMHINVEKFKLGTEDPFEDVNWDGYTAQKSPIIINRTVSLSSLNFEALVGSIIEELVRACNGAVNKGDFDSYIKKLSEKHLPKSNS